MWAPWASPTSCCWWSSRMRRRTPCPAATRPSPRAPSWCSPSSAWNWLLDLLSFRFAAVRRFAQPDRLTLIRAGVPQRQNLRREFITLEELEEKLREQGIEKMTDVKVAYLEGDGQISVIRNSPDPVATAARRRDRPYADHCQNLPGAVRPASDRRPGRQPRRRVGGAGFIAGIYPPETQLERTSPQLRVAGGASAAAPRPAAWPRARAGRGHRRSRMLSSGQAPASPEPALLPPVRT